jgi:predicted O-methyltransferase YrrM/GNAT superfamily N-acetyltransferase
MTGHEGAPPAHRYESPAAWREVDDYFVDALIGEDDVLAEARRSCADTTMPTAEVAANQGALLALLAQACGARRILEFGTLAGYSTIWLARAVGEEGRVVTLELEESNAAIARENLRRAGVSGRVDVLVGAAADSAATLVDDGAEPFDLVFIDADKPNNPRYLAAAMELTRPGSLIVIDNVVRNGSVTDAASADPRVQGVRAVTRDIAEDPGLEATAVQTVGVKGWDGMIIARRRADHREAATPGEGTPRRDGAPAPDAGRATAGNASTVTYRAGGDVGRDDLVGLYESVGWTAYTRDPARLEAAVAASLRVVTAWDEGRLIGLARVVGDGWTIVYLQDILVAPDHRRTGIGAELFRRVLEPFDDVRQQVLLTDDEPAQRAFYEAMGLTEIRDLQHPLRAFVRLG